MDSGSDGIDYPDDAIDKVAKANTAVMQSSHILPEVRASPCQIHVKKDRKSDILYMTNHHGGHLHNKPELSRKRIVLPRDSQRFSGFDLLTSRTSKSSHRDNRQPHRGTLPSHMSSKEFVMSWLLHGSEPEGQNHFPEIVKQDAKNKRKPKKDSTKTSSVSE